MKKLIRNYESPSEISYETSIIGVGDGFRGGRRQHHHHTRLEIFSVYENLAGMNKFDII